METERFVGIDVAQATLAVAIWPEQRTWEAANTVEGVEQLVAELRALTPERIVLEGGPVVNLRRFPSRLPVSQAGDARRSARATA